MSNLNTGCCDDSSPKGALNNASKRHGKKGISLFGLENPIPDQVNDPDEVSKMFSDYSLVPYAGSDNKTGQKLLYWYLMLGKLSPTHGACIAKLARFCFGSPVMLTRGQDIDFYTGNEFEIVKGEESRRIFENIISLVPTTKSVKKLSRAVFDASKRTGNAFVRLDIVEVNGQFTASLEYVPVTNVMYRIPKKESNQKFVAVSPIWTDQYLKKHPPEMLPVDGTFVFEDGKYSTMYHFAVNKGNWYGRPDSQMADLQKFSEVQQALYRVKQTHGGFVGNVIIEVEDDQGYAGESIDDNDASDSGFSNFADRFEQNFTMKSDDPQAAIITSRPFGASQMFVYQIKPNSNENWYKVTGEIDEDKILRAHQCTRRFIGVETTSGFSKDTFLSDFVLHMEPVINDLRAEVMSFINKIYSEIYQFTGNEDLNEYNLNFQTPIESILSDYRKVILTNINNEPNNSDRGVTIQPGRG